VSTEDILQRLNDDGIQNLWVIYHDYSGRACAKTVPPHRFKSALERGIVFARANMDFNLMDHLAPGSVFTAETGDVLAVGDPASYAPIPYRRATGRVHAFLRDFDGSEWIGCPRTQLLRMVRAYAERGLSLRVGFEPELMLFTHADKGEYVTSDSDGMFTVAGMDRHYTLWLQVMETLAAMGVQLEQLGKEYGPGQYEATTLYAEPFKAVDDYLTFKEVVRALAREAGWIASFMPKPYAHMPGCGLHVHVSLWDLEGKRDLSMGEQDDEPLSALGRHCMAGMLAHAAAITAVGAPIVNSYKRLLPGSWSPAHACWAVGSRAALVRIPGMGRRRHLEFRSGDNACNPTMLLTAMLAAGLDGIQNQLEPPPPTTDDVGALSDDQARARGLQVLPRSLAEALAALEADPVITAGLGPVIASEFVRVKRSELADYDLHVHPWERQLYLEVI
jgi:glutamine synthetase